MSKKESISEQNNSEEWVAASKKAKKKIHLFTVTLIALIVLIAAFFTPFVLDYFSDAKVATRNFTNELTTKFPYTQAYVKNHTITIETTAMSHQITMQKVGFSIKIDFKHAISEDEFFEITEYFSQWIETSENIEETFTELDFYFDFSYVSSINYSCAKYNDKIYRDFTLFKNGSRILDYSLENDETISDFKEEINSTFS